MLRLWKEKRGCCRLDESRCCLRYSGYGWTFWCNHVARLIYYVVFPSIPSASTLYPLALSWVLESVVQIGLIFPVTWKSQKCVCNLVFDASSVHKTNWTHLSLCTYTRGFVMLLQGSKSSPAHRRWLRFKAGCLSAIGSVLIQPKPLLAFFMCWVPSTLCIVEGSLPIGYQLSWSFCSLLWENAANLPTKNGGVQSVDTCCSQKGKHCQHN